MMKPGTTNQEITEMFSAVAEDFNCSCLEGVLSHELKRFVIDGENTILAKPSPERQVETFELEPNKVYAIDCVMSTGEGRAIRKDIHPTTIYKRVVENQYMLKSKFSRSLLKTINSDHPTYPFSLRNFENITRARAGVKECLNHELLADYPVLHERDGEFIAQFKFTVVVRPNGFCLRTCGTPSINKDIIKTELQVQNPKLIELLNTSWEKKKKKKTIISKSSCSFNFFFFFNFLTYLKLYHVDKDQSWNTTLFYSELKFLRNFPKGLVSKFFFGSAIGLLRTDFTVF